MHEKDVCASNEGKASLLSCVTLAKLIDIKKTCLINEETLRWCAHEWN